MIDNILNIANNSIKLPAPMRQSLKLNDLIIVRLYPDDEVLNEYPQNKLNRNVYAYDLIGECVWQIQEAPHGGIDEDKAYMHITIVEGNLIAENWIGIDYLVNADNGDVSQAKKGIRPW